MVQRLRTKQGKSTPRGVFAWLQEPKTKRANNLAVAKTVAKSAQKGGKGGSLSGQEQNSDSVRD
jgi:hypothetical protein